MSSRPSISLSRQAVSINQVWWPHRVEGRVMPLVKESHVLRLVVCVRLARYCQRLEEVSLDGEAKLQKGEAGNFR